MLEQDWFLFAAIASISIGLYGFAQKMQSEQGSISNTTFIFYSYVAMTIFPWIGMLLLQSSPVFEKEELLYSLFITSVYIYIIKTRLLSLKYLSSSTYFINYRVISSIWLLLTGVLFFSENISIKEYLWIFVGFIVFYLLIEKKNNSESMNDLKKGFIFLFLWTIGVALLQTAAKSFAVWNYDVLSLIFFQWVYGVIFSYAFQKWENIKDILYVGSWRGRIFLLAAGFLFALSTIVNNIALKGGDLAIVYKIISYSLFIPIILSIIIYKEEVSIKKLIAFWLTIVSVLLFV